MLISTQTIAPQASASEEAGRADMARHARGLEVLDSVSADVERTLDGLNALSPDLARFVVDFGYGDVLAREGLDLKTRELATVAALTGLGTAERQLAFHVGGALNAGARGEEIVEVILLASVYTGFPSALNGLSVARRVLAERGIEIEPASPQRGSRRERGLKALERISGASGEAVVASLDDIAPVLSEFIVDFSYGDVFSRPGLDDRTRELGTIAMLGAVGTATPQLEVHVNAALNVGATREEVVEIVIQTAVYAGFPAALNALTTARKVFEDRAG